MRSAEAIPRTGALSDSRTYKRYTNRYFCNTPSCVELENSNKVEQHHRWPQGHTVQCWPQGHTVQCWPQGHPVQCWSQGHPVQCWPQGHPVQCWPQGHPVQCWPQGHTVQCWPQGHTVQCWSILYSGILHAYANTYIWNILLFCVILGLCHGVRSLLFLDVTQRRLIISYRLFETTYRSHT